MSGKEKKSQIFIFFSNFTKFRETLNTSWITVSPIEVPGREALWDLLDPTPVHN